MSHRVISLIGCSGAGKSTLASKLADKYTKYHNNRKSNYRYVVIHSTDNYFIDENGIYTFNSEELGKAHKWNFDNFKISLQYRIEIIIIDNITLSFSEIRPYMLEAFRNNYKFDLEIVKTSWAENIDYLVEKNVHNVPQTIIEKQIIRFKALKERIKKGELCNLKNEIQLQVLTEKLGGERTKQILKKVWPNVFK